MSERVFRIAGPLDPHLHYFVAHRLDRQELSRLIKNGEYFILHAPRQSGKTTAIMEFCRYLSHDGSFHTLYINVEAAQAAREDVKEGLMTILRILLQEMKAQLSDEVSVIAYLEKISADNQAIHLNVFNEALEYLAMHASKPLVLFIDEIDALIGDTLLSVLRQIRSGYMHATQRRFPHALCLIGLRDVRDYRVWSKQEGHFVSTSSPFNIQSESLVLSNFTDEQIKELYQQHTDETGQHFSDEAIAYVYELSAGQPWLVNALAYQACYRDVKDPSVAISKEAIAQAKEALIRRRDTHIDSLLDKLQEPRVRPIIEAIITGEADPSSIQVDDLQYVRDLGLIRQDRLEIANPIYREIIPRELTAVASEMITQNSVPFTKKDGSLNVMALMENFVAFYRENADIWLNRFDYKEAAPHLLMMAFLQRVINGGGTIQREYALGTKRVDLLIRWRTQSIVIELKIRHSAASLSKGLQQTARYMDTANATEGHLVLFDRHPTRSWDDKIFHLTEVACGKTIHVWGC